MVCWAANYVMDAYLELVLYNIVVNILNILMIPYQYARAV
jgi:hypothetical protein